MSLSSDIQSDVQTILNDVGSSINVYLNPVYSYDAEGNATITKGTATSANSLIYSDSGEMITPETEGIDKQLVFRCFLDKNVGTIDEQDIIEFNSEYYKIASIDKNPLEDQTVTFYDLQIERIEPQDSVS